MSGLSSSTGPSSTFWIIDTTSVSDTFTTTATFTLWVPLNTPSTTPVSASASPEPSENPARSNTPVLAGAVIGAVLGGSLVLTCFVLYYKRRVKRAIVQPRTKLCDTPSGSEHALFDLAAEPAPHPDNIEPWVAPVMRRSNKARDEARRHQDSSAPRTEAVPRVEHVTAGASSNVQVESLAERRIRSNLQVEAVETHRMSAIPGSRSHGHDPVPIPARLHLHQPEALSTGAKSTAVPRRRAPREPSPPRLEEDAGVSLMRAGDDALPPSYGDLVHDRPV
ncbi:unnamed protein product [Rhizoctonia solani]|uniref:Transmembrane protein n=1 Tax=Rhizoctonia solani TaxID=456999 RepID=A0A8H3HTB1_9AGAM|nr:unnamed protein product [Rhizoctonia solani]CAE6537975.1 unnamed protein product [Rhizoctonia solani]